MRDAHEAFMLRAIELAQEGVDKNQGGPFGCVIVKDGRIVGEGCNRVTSTNDPTAHAEIVAIREACRNLDSFQIDGCYVYTSCEPCPMCLGALYWARPTGIYIAGTRDDAADAGFDDGMIYEELQKPNDQRQRPMQNICRDEAIKVFRRWVEKPDKVEY